MKIYVGNLPYSTNDVELRQMFEAHGAVDNASVVMDRESGRSRGFGFVEMGNQSEAEAAINALNGQDMGGRALTVNEARPSSSRSERCTVVLHSRGILASMINWRLAAIERSWSWLSLWVIFS